MDGKGRHLSKGGKVLAGEPGIREARGQATTVDAGTREGQGFTSGRQGVFGGFEELALM